MTGAAGQSASRGLLLYRVDHDRRGDRDLKPADDHHGRGPAGDPDPRGGGVIMNIPFATDLILENLVFDAGGASNCGSARSAGDRDRSSRTSSSGGSARTASSSPPCRGPGPAGPDRRLPHSRALTREPRAGLQDLGRQPLRPHGDELAVLRPDADRNRVRRHSISSVQVTNCRFVDVRDRGAVPGPKQELEEVLILNNTFYKAADAIVFNHAPDAKRPMKSALIGNLFAGSTTTDVSVGPGSRSSSGTSSRPGGPGDRRQHVPAGGELRANEVDVFGQGESGPSRSSRSSRTTPGTPGFSSRQARRLVHQAEGGERLGRRRPAVAAHRRRDREAHPGRNRP